MSLIGSVICKWKGSHKWGRAVVNYKAAQPIQDAAYDAPVKSCKRCGITVAIKPRTRKAKVAIVEGGGNG